MTRVLALILSLIGPLAACLAADPGEHWAFMPPQRPRPAVVRNPHWPRNPIDAYLLQRLESRDRHPAQDADRATILRRASFTLTGLPPSSEECGDFFADAAPDSYERLLDRLLASSGYGERLAAHWLDLARYADTHGYHADTHRDMWRWRDWVIDAWNHDLEFEPFTVEQIAGDLLPNPTLEQRIATGFNRNHMVNFENGAIPEEYRCEYVADRTTTTSTVWLGLTIQCARCHDHKHDPIKQTDFYQLYAFFNNIAEQGLDGQRGNAAPTIAAPTRLQQERIARLTEQIEDYDRELGRQLQGTDSQQEAWEAAQRNSVKLTTPLPEDTSLHFNMDELFAGTLRDRILPSLTGLLTEGAELARGKAGSALLLTGETVVTVTNLAPWRSADPLTISLWMFPTTLDDCTLLARVDGQRNDQGMLLSVVDRRLEIRFHQDGNVLTTLVVRADAPLVANRWQNITVTLDGSDRAEGIRCYLDGTRAANQVLESSFLGPLTLTDPLQIGGRAGGDGLRGLLDDVRIFSRELRSEEIVLFSGRDPLIEMLAVAPTRRTESQRRRIRQTFLEATDASFRRMVRQRQADDQDRRQMERAAPTSMIMQELTASRPTFVLERGLYDAPGIGVEPGLPRILDASGTQPRNRLALARWLASDENPLAARVMVNRLWQLHWGRGIVNTLDDFGTRGERPSHPELLDWLAVQFLDRRCSTSGSMKRLQRQMLLSSSFRQASVVTAESFALDPENREFARGPRLRLSAEMIRDQALSASGLLDRTIGGPSVFPYQPAGLWEEVAYDTKSFTAQTYTQSHGAELVRRGLYTFWKRAVPPTSMAIWDAPDREACAVSRTVTNTPLQSLSIWNEPTFVEAARYLAQSLIGAVGSESSHHPQQWLDESFLRITSRRPTSEEQEVLRSVFASQLARFKTSPSAAAEYLEVGENRIPADARSPMAELAALASVIGSIWSLDESLSSY